MITTENVERDELGNQGLLPELSKKAFPLFCADFNPISSVWAKCRYWQDIRQMNVGKRWPTFRRDLDIGLLQLWSKVKGEATLEREKMRDIIFEGLK